MQLTSIDLLWILVSSCLVFLMQAGFCCLECGLVRSKNSINVAIKNVLDFCVSSLLYWAVGYGLMFGISHAGLWGTSDFLPDKGHSGSFWVVFLFQLMFCGTATTIVSGAVAERVRFSAYLVCCVIVSGLVYPLFGHWTWGNGWLKELGFIDFAGSTVVHSVGGWAALAAIVTLGPRLGRFDQQRDPIHGHNLVLAALGVFLLWFGWYGFNGGSTLALTDQVPLIAINTTLAAVAGGVASLIGSWCREHRPDVVAALNGVLAGLVGITASCHLATPMTAILIGAATGLAALLATWLLDKLQIDDAVGAFPVHAVGGICGTLMVALVVPENGWSQLSVQAIGITTCAIWAFGITWLLLQACSLALRLRVTLEEEEQGLNISEHGATIVADDLLKQMQNQQLSGNFSLRAAVEPHTEIGLIATQYNRVLSRVEHEISTREETARQLKSAQAQYRDIVENAVEGIFQTTLDGRYRSANPALIEIYGYDDLADLQLHMSDIGHQLYVDPTRRDTFVSQLTQHGEIRHFESEVFRKDGSTIWIEEQARVVRKADGTIDYFEGSVLDVTQRRLALAASQACEAAVAANEAKSQFLARMSHEIRTPLNGVLGMLDLLAGKTSDPQHARYVEVAQSSGRSLLTLVNDILDISKIEASKLELDCHPFDLRLLVEESILGLSERASQKGLAFVCRIAPEVKDLVIGDSHRLRQILVNLVGNAIKFTSQGQVFVNVTRDIGNNHLYTLQVQDTGIGIPYDRVGKMFQAFSQADASTTRQYGGSGLGLAICKELVELMGGKIGVESTPQVGSTFWVKLELPAAARTSALTARSPDSLGSLRLLAVDENQLNRQILSEMCAAWGFECDLAESWDAALLALQYAATSGPAYSMILLDEPLLTAHLDDRDKWHAALSTASLVVMCQGNSSPDSDWMRQHQISAIIHKPFRQSQVFNSLQNCGTTLSSNSAQRNPIRYTNTLAGRVLVVDDNEINRFVVQEILVEAGLTVETASSGEKAFEITNRQSFDLVLMDCEMPGIDGLQATRHLRRQPKTSDWPIIALTANAIAGEQARCLAAGMNDYVSKPINPTTLLETLARWLPPVKQLPDPKNSQSSPPDKPDTTASGLNEFKTIKWNDLHARCLNKPDLVRTVLQKALGALPPLLARLVLACESNDQQAIHAAAHTLRGTSGNLGCEAVVHWTAEIEQRLNKPGQVNFQTEIKHIEQSLNAAYQEIERYLDASVAVAY